MSQHWHHYLPSDLRADQGSIVSRTCAALLSRLPCEAKAAAIYIFRFGFMQRFKPNIQAGLIAEWHLGGCHNEQSNHGGHMYGFIYLSKSCFRLKGCQFSCCANKRFCAASETAPGLLHKACRLMSASAGSSIFTLEWPRKVVFSSWRPCWQSIGHCQG